MTTKRVIVLGVDPPARRVKLLGMPDALPTPKATLFGPATAPAARPLSAVVREVMGEPAVPTRDEVTALVRALDAEVAELGRQTGLTARLDLVARHDPNPRDGIGLQLAVALADVARVVWAGESWVSIEAHRGVWGLYFTRVPPHESHEATTTVPLVAAKYEVREWFVGNCRTFVAAYLARCEAEVFGPRRAAAREGEKVLGMLTARRR